MPLAVRFAAREKPAVIRASRKPTPAIRGVAALAMGSATEAV